MDKPKQNKVKREPKEIISLDMGEEGEETADLDPETTRFLLEDALEEEYAEEVLRHTYDVEIQESFVERQNYDTGRRQLDDRLDEHTAESPTLSGGDIDAAWDDADVGEETVGGMNPTPDQDVVDELGQAAGLTYEDDEPLHTGEKLEKRDRKRWELDPESAEDEPA